MGRQLHHGYELHSIIAVVFFLFADSVQGFLSSRTHTCMRKTSLTSGLKLAHQPADVACPERRQAMRSLLLLPTLIPTLANAVDDPSPLLKVTTQLSSGASIQDIDLSKCALYITARPNTADNVPRAILDGSRGKPPPVLIARIANIAEFPSILRRPALQAVCNGIGLSQQQQQQPGTLFI